MVVFSWAGRVLGRKREENVRRGEEREKKEEEVAKKKKGKKEKKPRRMAKNRCSLASHRALSFLVFFVRL